MHNIKKFQKLAKNSNKCKKCNTIPATLTLERIHFYWKHTHEDIDMSKNLKCKICKSTLDTFDSFKEHLGNHRTDNGPKKEWKEGGSNLMSKTKKDQPTNKSDANHLKLVSQSDDHVIQNDFDISRDEGTCKEIFMDDKNQSNGEENNEPDNNLTKTEDYQMQNDFEISEDEGTCEDTIDDKIESEEKDYLEHGRELMVTKNF